MKESPKWKKIKRKKEFQTVFLVAICLLCVIMYKNGQGADVCVELAPEPRIEGLTEASMMKEEEKYKPGGSDVTSSDSTKALSDDRDSTKQVSDDRDVRVNINKALKEELLTLSGIGETKAEAILKYRTEQGPFACAEDIMKVPGIKEGTFGKIKDKIKV